MNCKMLRKPVVYSLFVFFLILFSYNAQAADSIKIGVAYPLSGAMALMSNGIIKGHEIAVAEINKSGGILGRSIELIIRDDEGKPEINSRICREFAIRNNVDWIFSGYGTGVALSAEAIAGQFKTPLFIFGGHSPTITDKDLNEYSFRYAVTTLAEGGMLAKVLAEQVLKDDKDPTIYWISWDYEYGHSLHAPFMKKIKELLPNVRIVGEAWPRTGETDYGPFINEMLALKPDVIVNAVWGGGVVSLLKQCNQMGIWQRSKLASMALVGSIEYRLVMGEDMPEGTWSHAYDDKAWPNNDEQHKFYAKYRQLVGDKDAEVPSHAIGGYEQIYMMKKAIETAGSTNKEAMVKAMETVSINSYRGEIKMRAFDHQVVNSNVWAPMIKVPGQAYLEFDSAKIVSESIAPDLYSFDEWLKIRKAAGKDELWK
jgi:branched-chain amino acid transport system substrate-binding protein